MRKTNKKTSHACIHSLRNDKCFMNFNLEASILMSTIDTLCVCVQLDNLNVFVIERLSDCYARLLLRRLTQPSLSDVHAYSA